MYIYTTANRLRHGQHFQFINGVAINQVVHVERNLLVYTNIITGRTRRISKFNDADKINLQSFTSNPWIACLKNIINIKRIWICRLFEFTLHLNQINSL